MKKLVLGLFLAFAALALLQSPALAETKEPQVARILSAADRAFLASLAAMPLASAPAAKPSEPDPPIGEMALCTASATCRDGNTISCQGNNSATSCTAVDSNCLQDVTGYVTCDGNTTWCPRCPCPRGWCDGEGACASRCYPCAYTYTCNGNRCTDDCLCNFQNCPV